MNDQSTEKSEVRTIIVPIGSGGPDPLDQYGNIGWRHFRTTVKSK